MVQAFPALIRLKDLEKDETADFIEIPLGLHGLIHEFTVQQDLEKGCVFIWGIAQEGRFRLRLEAAKGQILLWAEKTPSGGISIGGRTINANQSISWSMSGAFQTEAVRERLSLGSHRSQDWAGVWRRMDLNEILPILFHLSQWTPIVPAGPVPPMMALLDRGWIEFLRAGFGSILVPRLQDPEYQGLLASEPVFLGSSAISLINRAKEKIRQLFIEQSPTSVCLLKTCDFTQGRFVDVQLPDIGSLDLEWAKGSIHRAIIRAEKNTKTHWHFSRSIRSFRLRNNEKDRGERKSAGDVIEMAAGNNYFLDRFQK